MLRVLPNYYREPNRNAKVSLHIFNIFSLEILIVSNSILFSCF